jgi:hypothetical protein
VLEGVHGELSWHRRNADNARSPSPVNLRERYTMAPSHKRVHELIFSTPHLSAGLSASIGR